MLAIFRPLFAEKHLREQLAGIVWPGPEENVVIRGKIGTWSAPLLCIANPKMATSYMSVVARPIDAALCRDVSVLFHRKSQAFLEAADNIDALWSDGWATTPNFLVRLPPLPVSSRSGLTVAARRSRWITCAGWSSFIRRRVSPGSLRTASGDSRPSRFGWCDPAKCTFGSRHSKRPRMWRCTAANA